MWTAAYMNVCLKGPVARAWGFAEGGSALVLVGVILTIPHCRWENSWKEGPACLIDLSYKVG
jgi:hypothetical protein